MAHEDTPVKVLILSERCSILLQCSSKHQFGHTQLSVWGPNTVSPSFQQALQQHFLPLIHSFQLAEEKVSKSSHRRGNSPLTTKQALTSRLLAGEQTGVLRRKTVSQPAPSDGLSSPVPRTVGPLGLLKGPIPSMSEWVWCSIRSEGTGQTPSWEKWGLVLGWAHAR